MANLKYYNETNSQWETLVTGKQGPTGPTGPTGPEGPQGETGPQGPAGTDNSESLSKAVLTFHAERNGIPGVGSYYAFGNGSATTRIVVPVNCKLVMGTFWGASNLNGTITVEAEKNGTVSSSHSMTITEANKKQVANFYSAPLSLSAGDELTWRTSAVSATEGVSTITFYLLGD
jgi:hypothetical protein